MGQELTNTQVSRETRLKFIRQLLNDIEALEFMIDNNLIESGITRIGAEQEFCLVDKHWRPAKNAQDLLPLIWSLIHLKGHRETWDKIIIILVKKLQLLRNI